MFTGLIETLGKVRAREDTGTEARIVIKLDPPSADLATGESIAVNGVCLTAEAPSAADRLIFFLSAETLDRTTLSELEPGRTVNLERSLRLGDRLGGHLVSGHVDAVGEVLRLDWPGQGGDLEIAYPTTLAPFITPKGSIAVDGISLTIVDAGKDRFTVALVPQTIQSTTLRHAAAGDRVNLEVDLLARYVVRALEIKSGENAGVSAEELERAGFMRST